MSMRPDSSPIPGSASPPPLVGGESPTRATRTSPSPATATEPRTERARRYKVLVHNDDRTPMDFVVRILTGVYRLGVEHAIEVMLEAHNAECALVRCFGLEEAEFRVEHSHHLARTRGYPLTFSIEPE